jgi:hypothetical protein
MSDLGIFVSPLRCDAPQPIGSASLVLGSLGSLSANPWLENLNH